MKRQQFKLKAFLFEFIDFLESHQPVLSPYFAIFCHLISHLQFLSFIIRIDNNYYWEPKLAFLANIVYYSNFMSFLGMFGSEILTEIVFFLVLVIFFGGWMLFFVLSLLRRSTNMAFLFRKRYVIFFFDLFVLTINVFNWVLLIPLLDLYISLYECSGSYNFSFCESAYVKVLCILMLILGTFVAFLVLWANRAHSFLETGLLRMKYTIWQFISLFLRVILVCLFSILNSGSQIVVFLLVILIILVNLYNFFSSHAMGNKEISIYYFRFELLSLLMTFYFLLKDFTTLLSERNLFYSIMIAGLFVFKTTIKIFDKSRKELLSGIYDNLSTLSVSLSDFYTFFQNKQFTIHMDFFFQGLRKTHAEKCKDTHCPISREKMQEFEKKTYEEEKRIVNDFVSRFFLKNIRTKEARISQEFENLLLHYGSFITYHNMNPIHAFLDLEKAFSLNKTPSFYFRAIVKSLEKSLKAYIREYDKRSKEKSLQENKEMDVMTYSEMHKVKKKLTREFQQLLKEKVKFWEMYKDGFASYDELFKSLDKMNTKVVQMNDFLKLTVKQSQNILTYKVFPLKFLSILSCVLLNQLSEGVKLEDEIDKLKKRELSLHKEILNSTSFFQDNVLFLQVSFLDPDGFFLETFKTQRVADFFGYTREELKSMRSIREFMPRLFRSSHKDFVLNYINKPRTVKTTEKAKIETFAMDKMGFVFFAKIYLGHCFDYANDFVFQSAIIKSRSQPPLLLFDGSGDIQGVSHAFYSCLDSEFSSIAIKDFYYLNLFCLVPNLKDVLEKNNGFEDETVIRARNKLGFFYIPNNLSEIIQIFKMKEKDEEEIKSHRSFASSKSQKTERSKKEYNKETTSATKNSKFLTRLFQTTQLSEDYRNILQRKYAENTLKNHDIMKEFIDYKASKRFKITFDLAFSSHELGADKKLRYATLTIQKISKTARKDPLQGSFIEMKSQSIGETEKDPTMIVDSEIKSGFINMPPINIPEFREPKSPDSEPIENENNRLFTTDPGEIKVTTGATNLVVPGTFIVTKGVANNSNNVPSLNEIGSSNDEKGRKDEDSLAESSNSQKNEAEKDREIGKKTSVEKIYEAADISSQSSSLSSLKKTYAVFNLMSVIQKQTPSSLYSVAVSRSGEIFFIVVFCVYLLILTKQYIYYDYLPLEDGLINFSNVFNAYALTTSILFQTDLMQNNMSFITTDSLYFNVFLINIQESYKNIESGIELERRKSSTHQYQDYFKSSEINVTNFFLPQFNEMTFINFVDKITELNYEVDTLVLSQLDNSKTEYFEVNFLPFTNKIEEMTNLIWAEFSSTNSTIFNSIELMLILFVIFLFVFKFFEFYQLEVFYRHLVKIVNIFLRTNHSEAMTEILATNDTLKLISDESERFLTANFAEELLNRKTIKIAEDDNDLNRRKHLENEKKIKKKNKSLHLSTVKRNSMKPLSRIPRMAFTTLSYVLIFCFLFFNYFYCSIVNTQIVELINVSTIFQNLYTLPSGIISAKLLVIRNKLFVNQFATEINRMQEIQDLYSKLLFNTQNLETTNTQIPNYAVPAIDHINSAYFSDLLTANMCDVLSAYGAITSVENAFCESIYDGVFKNGLLAVNDIFINTIKMNADILNPNNTDVSESMQQFLQAESVAVDICAIAYINQALQIFYQDLHNYYLNSMLQQQTNLQIMLILTTVFVGGGFLAIIVWYFRFCKRIYRNITLTLSMIPYDRLINDEQTIFLIKKFGKD